MILSAQQEQLLDFVKVQHKDQKRKYTFEPYWNHLYSVAKIASEYVQESIEIALCHDLFEDTACSEKQLSEFLLAIGYSPAKADSICSTTLELTDKYVKEDFPLFNRAERKSLEAIRLGKNSQLAQSIKYADLIDNARSIVKHDQNFARVFLREMMGILDQMRNGNINLFVSCCSELQMGLIQTDLINNELIVLGTVPDFKTFVTIPFDQIKYKKMEAILETYILNYDDVDDWAMHSMALKDVKGVIEQIPPKTEKHFDRISLSKYLVSDLTLAFSDISTRFDPKMLSKDQWDFVEYLEELLSEYDSLLDP